MRIMLISGHGAGDPGAIATIDGVRYRETDLTVELVKLIDKELAAYDVTVSKYPYERDAYQDYKSGNLSFDRNINYVLEVHFNAGVKDYAGNGITTGTEIYYPSKRGKPTGAENALLRAITVFGFRDRGSAPMALAVINTAHAHGIPANLLEVCFIDDADDMRLYRRTMNDIAHNIAAALAEQFNLTLKEVTPMAKPWWEESGELRDAVELGITDGTRPTDTATRVEVAAMVLRGIRYILNEFRKE